MHGRASSPWSALLWLTCVIAASAIYRRLVGKPVLFFNLPAASFLERAASGHSNDNILRQIGGARNCLVVGVVADRFIVRPIFPFTLMFLPEIYGLEYDIKVSDIVGTKLGRFLWMKKLVVTFLNERAQTRSVTLYLKNPERLAELLQPNDAKSGA
jgi:hypothetical protein